MSRSMTLSVKNWTYHDLTELQRFTDRQAINSDDKLSNYLILFTDSSNKLEESLDGVLEELSGGKGTSTSAA